MAAQADRGGSPTVARSLKVRGFLLAGLVTIGWVSSQAIAMFAPAGDFLSSLFVVYGTFGMVFASRGIWRGARFLRGEQPADTPEYIYVVGNMRREVLRFDAHLVLFLMGVFALLRVPWFNTFFVASMFNLLYVMDVNGTMDDLLGKRMRQSQARVVKRAVTEQKRKRKGG